MEEIPQSGLRETARELAENGLYWHFHLLTPTCSFNEQEGRFAFVIEDSTSQASWVSYSDEPDRDLGKELSPLVHGADVFDSDKPLADLSRDFEGVRAFASEMSEGGEPWHHHMLFPDCIFNPDKPKWSIVVEGPTQLMSASAGSEPRADLAVIEQLFYKQTSIG